MKTITIPKKFGYPTLDIHINGEKYTIESGKEISVADEVAEVIENAIALEPKIGVPRNKIAQRAEESLKELTAEDLAGISVISNCAFYSCKSLINLTIPNNITKIGDSAFDWCLSLENVYLPERPPILAKTNAFGNIHKGCIFYCKTQESLEAYRTAANWNTVMETYTFTVEE